MELIPTETADPVQDEGIHEPKEKLLRQRPDGKFLGTAEERACHHRHYETRQEASQEITEYIEIFCNRQRQQKRLWYLSPTAYERRYYEKQLAA